MTENIIQTQALSFYKASWTDDKTIQRALEKLNKMKTYVGFTDSVLDSDFVEKAYNEVKFIKLYCAVQYLLSHAVSIESVFFFLG